MRKKRLLTMRSTVRTLSIKVYDEQLPRGWNDIKRRIRRTKKSDVQILAIKHHKDFNADDWWEPSNEKPHYHIIVRVLNNRNMHVSCQTAHCGRRKLHFDFGASASPTAQSCG